MQQVVGRVCRQSNVHKKIKVTFIYLNNVARARALLSRCICFGYDVLPDMFDDHLGQKLDAVEKYLDRISDRELVTLFATPVSYNYNIRAQPPGLTYDEYLSIATL